MSRRHKRPPRETEEAPPFSVPRAKLGRRADDHDECGKCHGVGFLKPADDIGWVPCPGPTGTIIVVRAGPPPRALPRGAKAAMKELQWAAKDNEREIVVTGKRARVLLRLLGIAE